ncbi:DUF1828 domain-containing protein [Larkinella bovis]|uniref:DUF1828 domain-containing protein n=1 Tax=Larkinella bovis TaxID=683041 RepID=A0ABW0IJV6_9BACT
MIDWINPLMNDYHQWLKDKTVIFSDNYTGWVAISTPFIGIFNDAIEIYAKLNGDKILLSDNGETINNLDLVGVFVNRGNKKDFLERILLNYGVRLKDDELWIEATVSNFPQKKHSILSAMIELNDLYTHSNTKFSSPFKDAVRDYLDSKNIIYTPDFISKGSTGIEFVFDFQIALKDKEVVLKSFNSLNKLNIPSFLFAWDDIKPIREKTTKKAVKAIAVINDEKGVKPEFLDALSQKEADFILWSQKDIGDSFQKLAA